MGLGFPALLSLAWVRLRVVGGENESDCPPALLVMEPGDFPRFVTGGYKVEEGLLPLVLGEELEAWKVSSSRHLPSQCFPLGQQLIPMPRFVRHNSSTIVGDSELNLTIYLCKEIGLGVRDLLLLYSKLLSQARN